MDTGTSRKREDEALLKQAEKDRERKAREEQMKMAREVSFPAFAGGTGLTGRGYSPQIQAFAQQTDAAREAVKVLQQNLQKYKDMGLTGSAHPFSAFAGGNDTFRPMNWGTNPDLYVKKNDFQPYGGAEPEAYGAAAGASAGKEVPDTSVYRDALKLFSGKVPGPSSLGRPASMGNGWGKTDGLTASSSGGGRPLYGAAGYEEADPAGYSAGLYPSGGQEAAYPRTTAAYAGRTPFAQSAYEAMEASTGSGEEDREEERYAILEKRNDLINQRDFIYADAALYGNGLLPWHQERLAAIEAELNDVEKVIDEKAWNIGDSLNGILDSLTGGVISKTEGNEGVGLRQATIETGIQGGSQFNTLLAKGVNLYARVAQWMGKTLGLIGEDQDIWLKTESEKAIQYEQRKIEKSKQYLLEHGTAAENILVQTGGMTLYNAALATMSAGLGAVATSAYAGVTTAAQISQMGTVVQNIQMIPFMLASGVDSAQETLDAGGSGGQAVLSAFISAAITLATEAPVIDKYLTTLRVGVAPLKDTIRVSSRSFVAAYGIAGGQFLVDMSTMGIKEMGQDVVENALNKLSSDAILGKQITLESWKEWGQEQRGQLLYSFLSGSLIHVAVIPSYAKSAQMLKGIMDGKIELTTENLVDLAIQQAHDLENPEIFAQTQENMQDLLDAEKAFTSSEGDTFSGINEASTAALGEDMQTDVSVEIGDDAESQASIGLGEAAQEENQTVLSSEIEGETQAAGEELPKSGKTSHAAATVQDANGKATGVTVVGIAGIQNGESVLALSDGTTRPAEEVTFSDQETKNLYGMATVYGNAPGANTFLQGYEMVGGDVYAYASAYNRLYEQGLTGAVPEKPRVYAKAAVLPQEVRNMALEAGKKAGRGDTEKSFEEAGANNASTGLETTNITDSEEKSAGNGKKKPLQFTAPKDFPKWVISQITNLEPDEIDSLIFYTSEKFWQINEYLRGKLPLGEGIAQKIKNIESAIEKSVIQEDIIVWRGANFRDFKNGELLKSLPIEDWDTYDISDGAFVSTSLLKKGAYNNGKEIMLEIHVPAGSHGIYLEDVSLAKGKGEYEMLLPSNSIFAIESVEVRDGKYYLCVKLVGGNR